MYATINGQQFHVHQCLEMGKVAFVKAHKGSVRDTVKVWEQIEKLGKKETPTKKKVEQPAP